MGGLVLILDEEARFSTDALDKIAQRLGAEGYHPDTRVISALEGCDPQELGRAFCVVYAGRSDLEAQINLMTPDAVHYRAVETGMVRGMRDLDNSTSLVQAIMKASRHAPDPVQRIRMFHPEKGHDHAQILVDGEWLPLCGEQEHLPKPDTFISGEATDACGYCEGAASILVGKPLPSGNQYNIPKARIANWMTGLGKGTRVTSDLKRNMEGVYRKNGWQLLKPGELQDKTPLLEVTLQNLERTQLIPRRAVVHVQHEDHTTCIPPDVWWRAYFFQLPPDRKTMESKRSLIEGLHQALRGRAYIPLLLDPHKVKYLLEHHPTSDSLLSAVIRGIERVEEVKNFYRVDDPVSLLPTALMAGDGSLERAGIRRADGTIGAYIKSLGHGRDNGRFRPTFIQDPDQMNVGGARMASFSSDSDWLKTKKVSADLTDIYAATLMVRYALATGNPMLLPFLALGGNDSYYSRNFRLLSAEVVVAHYLLNMPYFDIDGKILTVPELMNPALMQLIESGGATVQAEHQKRYQAPTPLSMQRYEQELYSCLQGMLKSRQFQNSGFQVEFPGTQYASLAQAWRKNGTKVNLLQGPDLPPFIIERQNHGSFNPSGCADAAIMDGLLKDFLAGREPCYVGPLHDSMTGHNDMGMIRLPDLSRMPLSQHQKGRFQRYLDLRRSELSLLYGK